MGEFSILGAGISGLASAITLAKKGHEVHVIEQLPSVDSRWLDNIRAMRNYAGPDVYSKLSKDFGLKLPQANPIFQIKKYSPSNKCFTVFSKNTPLFYTFFRGNCEYSLEKSLFDQAVDLGVNFSFNQQGKHEDCNIIASGSAASNIFGWGIQFSNVSMDSKTIHFFLDNTYASKGYYCIIPFNDAATLLAVTFDAADFQKIRLKTNKIRENNPIVKSILAGAKIENQHGGGGHYDLRSSAIVQNRFLVGDAAGFVEAARGFGQYYSLASGVFAGISLSTGENYDGLWKADFYSDLEKNFKRRVLLNSHQNNDYENMIASEKEKFSIDQYVKRKSHLFPRLCKC